MAPSSMRIVSVQRFRHPESQVISSAGGGGIGRAAPRRPLHVGVAGEGAGAEHAHRAVAFGVRAAVDGRMESPLQTVLVILKRAVHVMQTPGIGRKRCHRGRLVQPHIPSLDETAAHLVSAYSEVAVVVVERVSPGERGGGARARGVFPFRFGRQVIRIIGAALPVEPADELLCVVQLCPRRSRAAPWSRYRRSHFHHVLANSVSMASTRTIDR